jgi:hypothetical protein
MTHRFLTISLLLTANLAVDFLSRIHSSTVSEAVSPKTALELAVCRKT